MADAPRGAASRNLAQVDARLLGAQPHGGRRERLLALRASARRGRAQEAARPVAPATGAGGLVSPSGFRSRRRRRLRLRARRACGASSPSTLSRIKRRTDGDACRRSRRRAREPRRATGEGISTVALSVMTAARISSSRTRSPTLTCHSTSSASATPSPTSGSLITCSPMLTPPWFRAARGRRRAGPGK